MRLVLNAGLVWLMMTATVVAQDSVLVFGGTGQLGSEIVRQLDQAGYAVTVFSRPGSNRDRLTGLDPAYVTGDLTDGESVMLALDGRRFTYVVDASSRGRSKALFYADAMRNILAAIADSGVRQFVLHGSVGAGDNVSNFPDVPFGSMLEMLQAKGEAEDLLRASGIDYTIIRNGRLMPAGTPATGTARLTEDDTILASITRADLAILTLQCLGADACLNKTFHAVDDSL